MDTLTFECGVRDASLKTWIKTIQSLCLLGGTDMHFKFTEDALSVTTHDASVSAYATLNFNSHFFSSYVCRAKDADKVQCKVPIKCLLKPFRPSKCLVKMEEMRVQYTKDGDQLDITMITSYGASLNYSLRLASDSDVLELECDEDSITCFVMCDAKLILATLSNFNIGKGVVGDLTINISRTEMSFRSSLTDLVRKEGKVYTELGLSTVDFLNFSIDSDCHLTFPLREFKSFALLAETMKTPLTIRFEKETDGHFSPVMVTIRSADNTYMGCLTLANRAGRNSSQQIQENVAAVPDNNTSVSAVNNANLTTNHTNTTTNHDIINNNSIASSRNVERPTKRNNETSLIAPSRRKRKPAPLLFPNVGKQLQDKNAGKEIEVIALSSDED